MDERVKNGLIIAAVVALLAVAGVAGMRSFQGPAPQVQRVNTNLINPNDKTSDAPVANQQPQSPNSGN